MGRKPTNTSFEQCGSAISLPRRRFLKEHVGNGIRALDMPLAVIAESVDIDAVQQVLAATEEDGRDGDVEVVDEAGLEILADCGCAAAEADVFAFRGVLCLLERGVDAVGDEVEGCAAFHAEGRAWVMGEDEDGGVVGGFFAPPAFPVFVGPGAADGAEHVAAEDPGADVFEAFGGDVVVDAGFAALFTLLFFPGAGGEEPVEEFLASEAEGVLEGLGGAGAVAIEGDGEGEDAEFGGHGESPRMSDVGCRMSVKGSARAIEEELLADDLVAFDGVDADFGKTGALAGGLRGYFEGEVDGELVGAVEVGAEDFFAVDLVDGGPFF